LHNFPIRWARKKLLVNEVTVVHFRRSGATGLLWGALG